MHDNQSASELSRRNMSPELIRKITHASLPLSNKAKNETVRSSRTRTLHEACVATTTHAQWLKCNLIITNALFLKRWTPALQVDAFDCEVWTRALFPCVYDQFVHNETTESIQLLIWSHGLHLNVQLEFHAKNIFIPILSIFQQLFKSRQNFSFPLVIKIITYMTSVIIWQIASVRFVPRICNIEFSNWQFFSRNHL